MKKSSRVSLGCPCPKHAMAWTLPLLILHMVNVFKCWEEISSADAALVCTQTGARTWISLQPSPSTVSHPLGWLVWACASTATAHLAREKSGPGITCWEHVSPPAAPAPLLSASRQLLLPAVISAYKGYCNFFFLTVFSSLMKGRSFHIPRTIPPSLSCSPKARLAFRELARDFLSPPGPPWGKAQLQAAVAW